MTPKQMARLRWDKPDARAKHSARVKAHWAKISPADKRAAAQRMVKARELKRKNGLATEAKTHETP